MINSIKPLLVPRYQPQELILILFLKLQLYTVNSSSTTTGEHNDIVSVAGDRANTTNYNNPQSTGLGLLTATAGLGLKQPPIPPELAAVDATMLFGPFSFKLLTNNYSNCDLSLSSSASSTVASSNTTQKINNLSAPVSNLNSLVAPHHHSLFLTMLCTFRSFSTLRMKSRS